MPDHKTPVNLLKHMGLSLKRCDSTTEGKLIRYAESHPRICCCLYPIPIDQDPPLGAPAEAGAGAGAFFSSEP